MPLSYGYQQLENKTWEADTGSGSEFEEEQPTAIDPRRHLHYVEVSDDGLVATFVGRGEYTDVGVSLCLWAILVG